MDFIKFAASRFSVRQFKPQALPHDILEKILEAGHIAPTGCNNQPQRILVLNTQSAMEKLKDCTKCHFDAPCALLVCYNKNESWVRKYDGALSAPVDAAIVTTHMMLAAHDLGVGACWVMHFNPEAMRNAYNIPDAFEPLALLVMGYPADDAKPIPMHSAFRPMEETVYYETF